ncbi:MAG: SMC-Scp complex subunit ScpB [Planctomycetes bacterium]|jgi:segregation and condensation protein B|nr:SMC-Scp complex subunit ScpB [Planctomycetota bacterium]
MNEPEQPIEETADDATSAGDIIAASAIPQDALAAKLEALLFVHSRPVSARRLAELVGLTSVIPVRQALEFLAARYDRTGSSFTLQNLAQGYLLTTRPEHDELLKQLVREREAQKLSPATLEALAIIAYKQPISRTELENIRGAGVDHLVRNLLDRGLVKVGDRDSAKPGAPALYVTTAEFLRAFGLRSLNELPTEADLAVGATDAGDAEVDQAPVSDPADGAQPQ